MQLKLTSYEIALLPDFDQNSLAKKINCKRCLKTNLMITILRSKKA